MPLSTLTFVFTRRAGFPVYQTWFAALSHTLRGTVTAPGDAEEGLTVRLLAPDGRQVGETTTDADGSYRFDDLATYDGYHVTLERPEGLTSDDPLTRTVDLGEDDQVADFALRAQVPVAVSGTVRDADGTPLPGVEVRLTVRARTGRRSPTPTAATSSTPSRSATATPSRPRRRTRRRCRHRWRSRCRRAPRRRSWTRTSWSRRSPGAAPAAP